MRIEAVELPTERMHYVRMLPGDEVTVELAPHDPTRARIVFRER